MLFWAVLLIWLSVVLSLLSAEFGAVMVVLAVVALIAAWLLLKAEQTRFFWSRGQ